MATKSVYGRIENRAGKRKLVLTSKPEPLKPLRGDTPTGKGEMPRSAMGGVKKSWASRKRRALMRA